MNGNSTPAMAEMRETVQVWEFFGYAPPCTKSTDCSGRCTSVPRCVY